jgi:Glycosyltransferase like family
MIAFGSSITRPDVYRDCAQPGIELVAEPDSAVLALPSVGPIFASYNRVLEQASALDDLEALVLLHQDTEIVESKFCAIVRAALSDPQVGLIGCVGAIGVRSIAWWEGSVAQASFLQRFPEHGGGDLPAFSWAWHEAPPYARIGEVDTVDGFLMVLSPWVVRNLRFDESLGQLHGYDFDFCLQVREAGYKVVTADFKAVHSHSLMPFADPESWVQAHIAVAEKWDGRMPGVGTATGTWLERARRAEAMRDAAQLVGHANELVLKAQLSELERALQAMRSSISWRITRPLRQIRDVREGFRTRSRWWRFRAGAQTGGAPR